MSLDGSGNVINARNHKITNLATPTVNTDAATKAYVDAIGLADAALWATFPAVTAPDMSGNQITKVADPTAADDAATKNYVDTQGFITDASDWSLYPAIGDVDVADNPIRNVSFIAPGLTNTVSVIHDDAGNAPILEVEKFNNGATGPIMSLYQNTATPAVNDIVGTILIQANNSATNKETYGGIEVVAQNVTAGAEDGMVNLQVANNSGLATMIQLDGSLNQVVLQRELNVNNQDLRFVNEIKAEPVDGSNRYGLFLTTPKSLGFTNAAMIVAGGADRLDLSNNGVNVTLRKVITSGSNDETIAQLNFSGTNSSAALYQAGYVSCSSQNNTAGAEDSYLSLGARSNGVIKSYLHCDGSNNYIDALTHRIVNVTDPVDAQDAVTLNYINNTLSIPLDVVLGFGNNAGGFDIDMSNNDILQVSNLTNAAGELNISANDLNLSATGLLSVLNIDAVAGITLTSLGAAAINAVGAVQIGTAGLISIGSSADATEIEEVKFAGSTISKVTGEADISMNNIASIRNVAGNEITLTSTTTTMTTATAGRANPTLELVTTSAAAPGTYLQFYHNSASPAVGDRVGVLDFYANNDAATKKEYARMRILQNDNTNAAEDGEMEWSVIAGGSMTNYMSMDGLEGGVVINPDKDILSTSALKIYDSGGVTTNNTMMYADVSNIRTMFKNYPQRYLFDISGDYTLTLPDPGWNIIRAVMVGAGGGGGSGRLDSAGSCFGGGAGSGGNIVESWFDRRELFPDASGELTLFIRVGQGGAGGAAVTVNATNGNNGTAGGQTFVSLASAGSTSTALYYQLLGGNAGSGGTNAAGTGGGAPTFAGGTFGFAGRPGASSSITAQPAANTAGGSFTATMCQPPGGCGAGGGVNVGATVAYNGGSMASPAAQFYGIPAGNGLGIQTLAVGTAGTAIAAATDGATFQFNAPVSNAAVRPLRGNFDGFSGGGGSINATSGGGAGGGHTAGNAGSRGSGGGGGGGAIAVASGAGGRGRDGFVYLTFW
jgi:hypothetical protein